MTFDDLEPWVKKYEGFSRRPYEDTVGKISIGWGRNLTDSDLEMEIAELMFENDLKTAVHSLENYVWYKIQPESVQCALINMCFNMGITRLLGFKKMIAALSDHDYKRAALEALNSTWAKQVGSRAKDIALIFNTAANS